VTGERAGGIDAEIARLKRDLDEAREQLAAISEVLTALGRSASDPELVLGTVVESARRLCKADVAQVHLVEDGVYRLASFSGLSDEYLDFLNRNPVRADRRSLVGRVGLDRRPQQIMDVLADAEYGRHELQRLGGYRTVVGVPMLLDRELIGVLSVWRTEVDPFGDRESGVLTTFAAQAAIAIRQVNLVRALEARQEELGRKVEQLEALGHVGDAVSSSLDLDHVLATIVEHAVELSDTDGGSIFDFDETTEEFRIRTTFGTDADLVEALRQSHIGVNETLVGRVALTRQPQQVVDLEHAAELDPHLRCLKEAGWRSLLAVPILREERIIGALVVRRRTPGGFLEEITDLLETFASQSALAILNARLFKELEDKGAELEVASRHKSEFLASMSHELRTPLNAVIGFSEVLLERMPGDLNARQEDYLRDIWESGKHLLALLNDILDLSKVEAGRMELDYSVFSVSDALETSLALVRERAGQHRISLDVQVGPEVSVVEADELRVKQVLLNLLSNAVKFTGDGGRVKVRAWVDGEAVIVTVADNGLGVGPEDRERIFESFQQGTRGPPKTEGTGLGLTLSKRIVEQHGGRIWLHSEIGVGSTFGFTVPLRGDRAVGERCAETREPTVPLSPTVVIVEDDRRSRELFELYLERTGVEVVTASDGQEGLDVVRRLHPAAVVLDLYLPKLDGWDVLALLKADASTSAIPVIIVSMVDERGKGFALGAADYLVKPVGREQVLTALNRAVTLPGLRPTVVAIDDDAKALELVTAVLEPEGWTVLRAASGEDGVALTRSRHPSVVLVDLVMPGMDGFDVVAQLRGDPETAAIPIVILTAKTLTWQDKERLRGQMSYVAKKGELNAGELAELVRRATESPATPTREAP
jgi:signal transduction histidine kinase/DNA-binding response OmpR family regulator